MSTGADLRKYGRHLDECKAASELAWVIERDIASKLHYWTGEPYQRICWRDSHVFARRFARREDANCMLTWHLGDIGRVVQHSWSDPSAECSCGFADALLVGTPLQQKDEKAETRVDEQTVIPPERATAAENQPDPTCEHGVAWDVHCCGCHSGFLFDSRK